MMSHGHSFKTVSETYSTCVDDHTDESMHCTDGNSSVLHRAFRTYEREHLQCSFRTTAEKSAFISQYSSYESLVFLNILKYSHIHIWYGRLIHLSLDAFLITEIEKQNRRKWKRLLWKEKPYFIQS